jgi:AraC-like DNA-binding protein
LQQYSARLKLWTASGIIDAGQISVDINRRIIDYGDIVTAGGFLAWVDVGLFLVDRILGPAVKAETARFVLSDPASTDSALLCPPSSAAIASRQGGAQSQTWVHMRDGRGVSLASMATVAGLQKRTFLRRFANATGLTPLEYCRGVRIARARELLISGNTPQKMIAQSLAYRDVASFARAFRKATGAAPGAYRKRFGVPPGENLHRRRAHLQRQQKLPFSEGALAAASSRTVAAQRRTTPGRYNPCCNAQGRQSGVRFGLTKC